MTDIPSDPREASPQLIKQIIDDVKLRRQVTKNSHLWFFYIYFADYVHCPIADFHRELFAMTEREHEYLSVVTAFRGSAKSTLITLSYVLWSIFGKQQKKHVLIIGLTEPQVSIHFSNLRSALEDNELLKEDFGPYTVPENEWHSTSLVLSRYDARISAASIDKKIRGLRHKQYRPQLIILDDVEDLASVKTQESRDKLYSRFSSEIIPAGETGTRFVVIGTLLHRDSLLVRLKEAIASGSTAGGYYEYPLIDANGKILWPGKFPNMAAVERLRSFINNEVAWQREFMLRIVAESDQVILEDWLNFYDDSEMPPKDKNHGFVGTFIGVDVAVSETGDCVAVVPIHAYAAPDKSGYLYFLDRRFINDQLTPNHSFELIKQLYAGFRSESSYVYVLVEKAGTQSMLADFLRKDGIDAEAVQIHGDKRERLLLSGMLFEQGRVFFPKSGDCEPIIRQILGFGSEKFDDLVDATTLALNFIASEFQIVTRLDFGNGPVHIAVRRSDISKPRMKGPVRQTGV